jgi:PHD/YefM family antitoxin component YafN of YafNO toxin-antitoxin module
MHNNHPDAVLLSIAEYEKLSAVIEYLERSEAKDIEKVIMSLPKAGNRKTYLIENMKKDLNLQQKI